MNPAFLDNMSWEMAEVYGSVTDQILINLARYFPYYDARNFPRSSITYQADMLAQMGQVNKETMAIIRRNLVGVDKYLNAALEQVIIDSVQAVNPELWKAVKKGIFVPPQTPVVSPNQYRAFNLYYTQAANKLNLVNTVMLESTQQAYRATVADIAARVQATQTALDIGAGEVVTGVSSWNTATAHAIKRLQTNGITGFIDHGGHRWSAEAYVAMDIRTTMFNTGRAAVWETNQNFGNDLYQVSYHNGARPLCYPWQSKVISSTDNARVVADLDGYEVQVYAQSETSYGEPAGLFGINCKHYPTPFIPGVSIVREGGQSEEENAKTYEESQQQRGLERKIREEKRDLLMLKEQGAPDELIKAQRAKIRQTDDDIDAFCDATGRARRQNREAVYTKREFPSSKTYDVALFEQQQKEMIEGFYSVGGAQVEFSNTLGMTTNVPLVPKPRQATPPTPVAPVTNALTDAERSAVESYVSGDNMYINQVLRGRAGEMTTEDKELVRDIDSALNKPIGKTQTLYRSVDAEAVFGKMSAVEYDNLRGYVVYNDSSHVVKQSAERAIAKTQGKTVHELGYMSTTTDYEVASEWGGYTGSEKPIVLKLNTPGSTHGLALTDFEIEEEAQSEVLLSRGLRYKVNQIVGEDGNIVVYADILEK